MPTEFSNTSIALSVDPADDPALRQRAMALAQELSLPLVEPGLGGFEFLLVVTAGQLELRWFEEAPASGARRPPRPLVVAADFHLIDATSGQGRSLNQPIARAVGLARGQGAARPTVLDATAGWGEDAWLLASLGCRVIAVERWPIVAALLTDGLRRAEALWPEIAARVDVVAADARRLLAKQPWPPALLPGAEAPDVVYLDPMFPPKRRAGLERKEMRVLRRLVGADPDAAELLPLARRVARRRVVVKRPLHAPPLADEAPIASHEGKSLRYDVYSVE